MSDIRIERKDVKEVSQSDELFRLTSFQNLPEDLATAITRYWQEIYKGICEIK